MLTGQRRQEIGGLEWAEVRLQRAQPTKWPKDVLGRLLWYLADQR